MEKYSSERNVQILIAVLKANHIKKVVVSPGTTNISFIVSLINDGSFEMYSAVDERGAAYMACGLASESGEAVVITCTGSTASRNYFPGLTEAYHRKLPILAVTASQDFSRNGNLSAQFIDRTRHPVDAVKISVQVPVIRTDEDVYDATLKINRAVLEMFRKGGGPAHINLASSYTNDFVESDLSWVRVLRRYTYGDALPEMKKGRIAIIVGAHKQWSRELTEAVDQFCATYDAVVLVDHSSHYWGKYRLLPTIIAAQEMHTSELFQIDLLIHIGEEQGDYYTDYTVRKSKEVWRISEDGEIRDPYKKLTNVFEMRELDFFSHYAVEGNSKHGYLDDWKAETKQLYDQIPELPFSNIWIAQHTIPKFPKEAVLELGVSNTMRSWTFFDFNEEIYTLANTGCRGIDGAIPTALGMSLAHPDRAHYAVMGDLTFFYSFNVLGNRHVSENLRILLINNECGLEFNLYPNRAYKIYEGNKEMINRYIAAGGHTGTKKNLVKHYAEDLGFTYLFATSKEEYLQNLDTFLQTKTDKPMLFEVFTDTDAENQALKEIRNVKKDASAFLKKAVIKVIKRE